MKKISIILAVLATVAMTGCNKVSKEQYQQVTNTNDSLMYVALQQGNEIYELSTTLKSVSEQLDQINGQIEMSNGEDQSLIDKRDRLLAKLQLVQKTIQEKQQALDDMTKKYKNELGQNKVLKQTVERMQTEIAGYQTEISGYKTVIAQNVQRIDSITEELTGTLQSLDEKVAESEQQQQIINTQDEMLNTGYYLIADKSKLKELGLLEGGAFSKKRLTTKGFDEEGFTKIDIREVSELPLGSKKADILSSHPTSSYELVPQSNGNLKLVIKDQAAFWGNARYLVVKTK